MRSLLVVVCVSCLCGADWPQYRGANEAVAVGEVPVRWSQTNGVQWKTAIPGPGSSSPVVWGERVYLSYYSGYGKNAADPGDPAKLMRHLMAIDRNNGKSVWTVDVPAALPEDPYRGYITEHGYASSTPAADADGVYAFFGKSGVVAVSLEGKKLWQTSVGTNSDPRGWGSASSVVLHKNLVIICAASESRAIVALEKTTGKQVWKADGKLLSLSFSTPALLKVGTETELVVAMPTEVWGLNPDTGKLLWFATTNLTGNISPAVIAADGIAYISGGFQARGIVAIRGGGTDDVTKSHVVWSSRTGPYVPTPVLHKNRLYYVNEDGLALCHNAKTGEVVYKERLAVSGGGNGSRPYYASLIWANNLLYATSRKAGVFVLKDGDQFEQVVQNPALDASDFHGTPAAVDGVLYLRSNEFLYCIGR